MSVGITCVPIRMYLICKRICEVVYLDIIYTYIYLDSLYCNIRHIRCNETYSYDRRKIVVDLLVVFL